MRHASARAAGQERLTGGPWWFNSNLISSSGVLPTLALEFSAVEDGRFMTGGVNRTFTGAVNLTRASDGTFFDTASTLQTAVTNVARFDHNLVTGVKLGLLVEEERATVLFPSDFSTVWSYVFSSVSSNAATAPDGTSNADKIVENGVLNTHRNFNSIGTLTAAVYVVDVFVKALERSWIKIRFDLSGQFKGVFFNVGAGVGAVGTADSGLAGSIETLKNDWYRCSVTRTATVATYIVGVHMATGDTVDNYQGDSSSGLLVWGTNGGLGGFTTSHIDSVSGAVTRKADIIPLVTSGGLPHVGYDTAKDTYSIGFTLTDVTTEQVLLSLNDGTTDNRIELYVVSGNLKVRVVAASSSQADITLGTVTAGQAHTAAFSFITDAIRGSLDGAAEVNDLVSNTIPSVSQCDMFSQLGTTSLVGQGWLSYLYQYPAAFSGSELLGVAA